MPAFENASLRQNGPGTVIPEKAHNSVVRCPSSKLVLCCGLSSPWIIYTVNFIPWSKFRVAEFQRRPSHPQTPSVNMLWAVWTFFQLESARWPNFGGGATTSPAYTPDPLLQRTCATARWPLLHAAFLWFLVMKYDGFDPGARTGAASTTTRRLGPRPWPAYLIQ